MRLPEYIKDYIQEKSDYINDNQFLELYNDLAFAVYAHAWEPEYTGEFTSILLDAGINPLDHMKIIPDNYLCGSEVTGFDVPDNIIKISENAFTDSALEEIHVGKNVTRIETSAFSGCKNLWRVVMYPFIDTISDTIFFGCTDLQEITFLGRKEQWLKILKHDRWRHGAPNLKYIGCMDGDIEL